LQDKLDLQLLYNLSGSITTEDECGNHLVHNKERVKRIV